MGPTILNPLSASELGNKILKKLAPTGRSQDAHHDLGFKIVWTQAIIVESIEI